MSLWKFFKSRSLSLFGVVICTGGLSFSALAIPEEGHLLMMSGPSPYAIEVGKDIYKRGGNVVDVAVGMILSMSVTTPYYSALGGGGFALVKMGDKPVQALDFREVAPKKTGPKFYLHLADNASTEGGTSVGVPGIPAGLWALHDRYGKLRWSQLFKEPLAMAKDGFNVSGEWYDRTNGAKKRFKGIGLKKFFKKGEKPYLPGEIYKQPLLYKALVDFRDKGAKGFYEGSVAKDIVTTADQYGGVLTLEDLKNYKVRWLKPMITKYQDYDIYLMPPPSSGGVVIETALKLMDILHPEKQEYLSVNELHLIGEIESRAFRGRALLGDPDFHKNPLTFLLSNKYIKTLAKSISRSKASKLPPLTDKDVAKESHETTHIAVLDKDGNAVSMTVTLNGNYGSAVVTEKYGIALNNEMDDFTTHPEKPNQFGLIQGNGNLVEAGKRPLSSMSPTLVGKDGHILMSIGSPGGPRIITGVLQVLYRILARHMDADAAIQAPRVHDQFLPHKLYVDDMRFSPEVLEGLREMGHKVEPSWMGKVYVVRKNDQGLIEAAFDSRGEGAAGGY